MMSYEAIKIINNDITFDDSGRLTKVSNLTAIGQKIERRLTAFKTEYTLDVTLGLDFEDVFDRYNEDRVKLAVIECINQVSEVVSVDNVEITYNRNENSVTFSANVLTNYGTTTVTATV